MNLPERIGKFRVLVELGHGGMAHVFLAAARGPAQFEKLLAVKLLREELALDPDLVGMFLDEARLAARLNHPNIVHTYEVGQDGSHCYLAMDYLDGHAFGALLRKVGREHMPLALHVFVLAEVLAGLHHAHELCTFDGSPLGVVHRDVSPKNVIVTYEGEVKLVDFGIAKAADSSTHTAEGVFKGTTAYAAPEQARGTRIDARADIFAMGVLLWEALARRTLAPRGAEIAALASRVMGAEPRVADVVADAPPALAAICDRAMAFEPKHRYPSALAMRDDLEAWLAALPKRVATRDLAAFVSASFSEERSTLRQRIEERLRHVHNAGDLGLGAGVEGTGATPLTTRAHSLPQMNTSMSTGGARGWWRAALGIVAVLGSVTALLATLSRLPRRSEPAAAEGGPSPPPPAVVSSAELTLRYGPATAVAVLDGVPLQGNPFRGHFPRDGAVHRLEVRAPGYAAEERRIVFDHDLELMLDLRAEPPSLASSLPPENGLPGRPRARPAPPTGPRPAIDQKNPYDH